MWQNVVVCSYVGCLVNSFPLLCIYVQVKPNFSKWSVKDISWFMCMFQCQGCGLVHSTISDEHFTLAAAYGERDLLHWALMLAAEVVCHIALHV